MSMISERDRKSVSDRLARLVEPVKAVVFTQELECGFCRETRELLEELAGLTDKLKVVVKDFLKDEAAAKALSIDKIPAVAMLGEGDMDYGIRFYGIPPPGMSSFRFWRAWKWCPRGIRDCPRPAGRS